MLSLVNASSIRIFTLQLNDRNKNDIGKRKEMIEMPQTNYSDFFYVKNQKFSIYNLYITLFVTHWFVHHQHYMALSASYHKQKLF